MKKVTILFAFIISASVFTSCNKGNATAKINKSNLEEAKSRDIKNKSAIASVAFDKKEYNFGTVDQGAVIETVFNVTNTGNVDLVITNAKVTCGCTVPVWPKAPIKPGQTEQVQVRFNTAGKRNKQQKNITLVTNTETGREILTLKGFVTPKPKTPKPTK